MSGSYRPTRRGGRPRAASPAWRAVTTAVACLLMALASTVLAAPAGALDPLDCTPMGDPACRDLAPVVECVWTETNGTRTVVWGYSNPSDRTLRIGVGNKNKMSPGAEDQGQPTLFEPGTWRNVFTTNVPGSVVSWRLGNNTAGLTTSTSVCPTKPVSLVGNLAALGVYLLLVALAVPVSVRTRTRVPALARARQGGMR
jgi:hypothetical protein